MQNECLLSTNPADRNVVAYFQFVGTNLPAVFVFEQVSCVERMLKVLRCDYPDVDAKVLGYHCYTETHQRLEEAGMVYDLVWELELEHSMFASDSIYCQDRATLYRLAEIFTKADTTLVGKIQKFARIRRIYKGGRIERDFPQVPYTNVADADWV